MSAKRMIAVLFAIAGSWAAAPQTLAQLTYKVDANHSNVSFTVPIIGGMS